MGNRTETDNSGCKYISDVSEQPEAVVCRMVRGAELVLFNRCTDIEPLAGYRRSVKVVSPQAEVIFEDENGEIENIFGDDVPYDLNAPVIEIPREDYGIWYVDVMEIRTDTREK